MYFCRGFTVMKSLRTSGEMSNSFIKNLSIFQVNLLNWLCWHVFSLKTIHSVRVKKTSCWVSSSETADLSVSVNVSVWTRSSLRTSWSFCPSWRQMLRRSLFHYLTAPGSVCWSHTLLLYFITSDLTSDTSIRFMTLGNSCTRKIKGHKTLMPSWTEPPLAARFWCKDNESFVM